MYNISDLAKKSGVSTRTLRYYDEIDLLKPVTVTEANYRRYGDAEVERLQRILMLRALGLPLEQVKLVINNPKSFKSVLLEQLSNLQQKSQLLSQQIKDVEAKLAEEEGDILMTNTEKFEQMKRQKIQENLDNFGDEIIDKYGETKLKQANENFANLSEGDYQRAKDLQEKLFENLDKLSKQSSVDLDSNLAKETFELHRDWLKIVAPFYSSEYHRGLAEMYVGDERFSKFYNDQTTNPSVQILYDIIYRYV